MKQCCSCKKYKDEKNFWKHTKSKDWLQSRCKECKRLYDNNYYNKQWWKYKKHKQWISKNRTLKILNEIKKYAKEKWCKICWYNKSIAALQFHHRDQEKKLFSISEAISNWYSLENIKKEIGKCDILCANCHLEITAKQLWWYK